MSALKFAAVGAPAAAAVYVEDVFSTYLYTGNGATQTITNGIDLSGQGGLVWSKSRSAATVNTLYDTVRGATFEITSDTTGQQTTESNGLNQFNSNGYRIGPAISINNSGATYVSWTFREQPKFFDVVTYTGTGANRTIAHNLGAVPGCIMVKRTTTYGYNWAVYHRSLANTQYLALNTTAAAATGATWWNSTTPTSTVFSVGTDASVNASGGTYVAYIFAHDAGGFGLTGADNVISCGSSVGGGLAGDVTVNLGYEPQWVLLKRTDSATVGNWELIDNMRGWPDSSAGENYLLANTSAAEATGGYWTGHPTATGFTHYAYAGATYIYIAIRRPNKPPTVGTQVFMPLLHTGTGVTTVISESVGFPLDLAIARRRDLAGVDTNVQSRLQGGREYLSSNVTAAEGSDPGARIIGFDSMTAFTVGGNAPLNTTGQSILFECFKRAPGFFDEVCYAGTGVAKTETHNLQAVPELMIVKSRAGIGRDWAVYIASMGNNYFACLNDGSFQGSSSTMWNDTTPTSSVFTVGTNLRTNNSGQTYVAYLFATCAGVSKVGSYTGNGTTQTINCGFATGARFVLIKRTDLAGDWYVWDSARGIVAGNDPHLSLNTTAAEVTTDDSVDTASSGFIVNQLAATNINVSAATYIFLSCS
jgi:hypothetical protein